MRIRVGGATLGLFISLAGVVHGAGAIEPSSVADCIKPRVLSVLQQSEAEGGPQVPAGPRLAVGRDVNEQLLALMETAESSLDLSLKDLADSKSAQVIADLAGRGVRVRLLLDAQGSVQAVQSRVRRLSPDLNQRLRDGSVRIRYSNATEQTQARNFPFSVFHRKQVIVDGGKAFAVTSANLRHQRNVEAAFFSQAPGPEPLAVYEEDWAHARDGEKSGQIRPGMSDGRYAPSESSGGLEVDTDHIELVGPGTAQPDLRRVLRKYMVGARKRIFLAVFDFTDRDLLRQLVRIRRERPELDLRVVFCGAPAKVKWFGKTITFPKNQVALASLQKAGVPVRVYSQEGVFMHARLGVFDDNFYLGSADLRRASFDGNLDLGVVGHSRSGQLAAEGVQAFEELWQGSQDAVQTPSLRGRIFEQAYYHSSLVMIYSYQLRQWWRRNLGALREAIRGPARLPSATVQGGSSPSP